MYKPYAGIGSRETPEHILKLMYTLGYALAIHGFTLRSGGANGADFYFEKGADAASASQVQRHPDTPLKEIFLPWREFNSNSSELYESSFEAWKMASEIHPAWDRMTSAGHAMHARNCHQVMGTGMNSPVLFVACYTENGEVKGGTATAIKIAKSKDIPVFNFGLDGDYDKLLEFVSPYVKGEVK